MHFKSTNKNEQVPEKLHAVQTNQNISDTDVHMKEHEKHRRQSSHEYWNCHCFESGGLVWWRKVIDSWMTMAHQSINHLNERYSLYHMLPTCRTLRRLFNALAVCIFFSFWTWFKWVRRPTKVVLVRLVKYSIEMEMYDFMQIGSTFINIPFFPFNVSPQNLHLFHLVLHALSGIRIKKS